MEPNPTSIYQLINTIKQESEDTISPDTTVSTETRLSSTRPHQPAGLTVIAEAKYATEPVELHPELKKILESWHAKEGRKPPPCKYRYSRHKGWRPSKGYDREGREVILTYFETKTPISYGVLTAQFSDTTLKLVSNYFSHHGKFGSYLRVWLGPEEGFEEEPCIIRRFGEVLEDIEYQPEAWTDLERRLKKPHQESFQSLRSMSRKRTAIQSSINTAWNKRHRAGVTDGTSPSLAKTDGSDADADEDDDNDTASIVAEAPEMHIRQSSGNNGPPQSPQIPELFFKLVVIKFTVQHVRDFPLEECKTSKALFVKARSFYKIFDRDIKVEVLSCQLASRPDQHYIFVGSEGEFNLLVRQAQDVAKESGKPLAIEVRLVQS